MTSVAMPIDRTKHKRMVLTVPHELARAVQDYRFARRITTEAEAWRELVRKGLEAAEREEQEAKPRRKP